MVIKKDGSKEYYDRNKLKRNILLSSAKRQIPLEKIDETLTQLETERYGRGKEISSRQIGDDVLAKLKDIDQVTYVRFASVYKEFDGIEDFQRFIGCKVE
jgi:transcriptional repressor NrdR